MIVNGKSVSVIDQATAQEYDDWLMGKQCQFTLEQLMELAGQGVAHAICGYQKLRVQTLVLAGPGNNGGDGLVAARHLKQLGYYVTVWYPKRGKVRHAKALLKQLEAFEVPVIDKMPEDLKNFEVIVDAMFGFGFAGDMREPYKSALTQVVDSGKTVISVDVPSGWDVNGETYAGADMVLRPAALISLMLPKKTSERFHGYHAITGDFAPKRKDKPLDFPRYKGREGGIPTGSHGRWVGPSDMVVCRWRDMGIGYRSII